MSTGRYRVLHLGKYYPPHRGGMETYLQTLCNELRDSVDMRVVVANDGMTSSEGEMDGVHVSRVGTLATVAAAPLCPGMVSKIREAKADLVHIHVPNPGAVMAYLASGHSGPVVVSYHSDTVRQKLLGRLFQPILNNLLDRSAAIIVTSPNYIESSPVLPAYRDRCRVIPFGISTHDFDQFKVNEVAQLRQRFGSRVVLSVGRLVYYKGFEYLIRAMQQVEGQLIIIGDGPLRGALSRLAQQLGIEQRVHLVGNVEDLAPYYYCADVFVLPSIARSEAFGIVQLEAMACAKPVINTDIASGVPYVSLHGVTGLTVPPEDPQALGIALRQLLDNEDLRLRYGQAARRRLDAEFTLPAMVRRTVSLYEEVIQGPAYAGSAVTVRLGSSL